MTAESFPNLKPLLEPATVAVIGASENRGPGRQVLENLFQLGYKGKLYPVNPKYKTVLGLPCYPSLKALAEEAGPIDLAAILLGRDFIVPLLEEGGSVGLKAAWAFASGFAEAGEEGKKLQEKLRETCARQNILFCGPNCVGYLNIAKQTGAYSAAAPQIVQKGDVGFVAQSGYVCLAMANSGRGIGFSVICSSGNEAVLDATDYMRYMVQQEETKVIGAFIEQFRSPEKLIRVALEARQAGKPLILIKVGKSSLAKRATEAHTGALAGEDDVQDALFEKLGVIRVQDLEELFETAELFRKYPDPPDKGRRMFAFTLSGGIISLFGDLAEKHGFELPPWSAAGAEKIQPLLPPYASVGNPLDAWGYGKIEDTYPRFLKVAAEEEAADLLLVLQDLPPNMAKPQVEQWMVPARAAVETRSSSGKPVVVLSNTAAGLHPEPKNLLDSAGIPLLQGSSPALKAIAAWFRHGERKGQSISEADFFPTRPPTAPSPRIGEYPGGNLTEAQSKDILRGFGIPCPEERACGSWEEAVSFADQIGYPVALKVLSPDIPHKTEAGGVALNIQTPDQLCAAYDRILLNSKIYKPEARVHGVLCQKMVEKPIAECFCGVLVDPSFGPAVLFGLGGVWVEVLRNRSVGIPPLSEEDALRMVRNTAVFPLISGFRGNPEGDLESLVQTLRKLGEAALTLGKALRGLDINPLFVLPKGKGVWAIDAFIQLRT